MRTLQKNKRTFYYARFIATEPIYDEYGNLTGDRQKVYSEPVKYMANVSANVGADAIQVFGSLTNYSRTMTLTENLLREGDIIWFGIDTTQSHNYVVTKVADSLHGYLIAIQEVNANRYQSA